MPDTDICLLNVTELAPLVQARKISPVDIVQALLSRIDALNLAAPLRRPICAV